MTRAAIFRLALHKTSRTLNAKISCAKSIAWGQYSRVIKAKRPEDTLACVRREGYLVGVLLVDSKCYNTIPTVFFSRIQCSIGPFDQLANRRRLDFANLRIQATHTDTDGYL